MTFCEWVNILIFLERECSSVVVAKRDNCTNVYYIFVFMHSIKTDAKYCPMSIDGDIIDNNTRYTRIWADSFWFTNWMSWTGKKYISHLPMLSIGKSKCSSEVWRLFDLSFPCKFTTLTTPEKHRKISQLPVPKSWQSSERN